MRTILQQVLKHHLPKINKQKSEYPCPETNLTWGGAVCRTTPIHLDMMWGTIFSRCVFLRGNMGTRKLKQKNILFCYITTTLQKDRLVIFE